MLESYIFFIIASQVSYETKCVVIPAVVSKQEKVENVKTNRATQFGIWLCQLLHFIQYDTQTIANLQINLARLKQTFYRKYLMLMLFSPLKASQEIQNILIYFFSFYIDCYETLFVINFPVSNAVHLCASLWNNFTYINFLMQLSQPGIK